MMGFKQVIQQFKAKHLQENGPLDLELLPLLMKDLVDNGLKLSDINGKFYQNLAIDIYEDNDIEFIGYIAEDLVLLSKMVPMPKATEPEVVSPTPKAKIVKAVVDNEIVRTEHLVSSMPNEDDEGDPYYIPPEERISLRPEDCAPKEFDEEFCASLGLDTKKW